MGEVFRESIRKTAAGDYSPEQIAAWSAHPDNGKIWAERMQSRTNYLAVCDGRIVGFVQYEPPDHVDMTYVHPNHQRRGVAHALLDALEADAIACGTKELHTEASITARPFFEACGYELVTPQIVRVRGVEFLNYRMRKVLGEPLSAQRP